MELGFQQLLIFLGLAVVLAIAFVALLCDFLKGNNEQLQMRNIELRVRQDERERLGLSQPLAWLQGLVALARQPNLTESFARATGTAAPEASEPAPARPDAHRHREDVSSQTVPREETPAAQSRTSPVEDLTAGLAAPAEDSYPAMRPRKYDELKSRTSAASWASREELEQLAGRAARIRARHEAAQSAPPWTPRSEIGRELADVAAISPIAAAGLSAAVSGEGGQPPGPAAAEPAAAQEEFAESSFTQPVESGVVEDTETPTDTIEPAGSPDNLAGDVPLSPLVEQTAAAEAADAVSEEWEFSIAGEGAGPSQDQDESPATEPAALEAEAAPVDEAPAAEPEPAPETAAASEYFQPSWTPEPEEPQAVEPVLATESTSGDKPSAESDDDIADLWLGPVAESEPAIEPVVEEADSGVSIWRTEEDAAPPPEVIRNLFAIPETPEATGATEQPGPDESDEGMYQDIASEILFDFEGDFAFTDASPAQERTESESPFAAPAAAEREEVSIEEFALGEPSFADLRGPVSLDPESVDTEATPDETAPPEVSLEETSVPEAERAESPHSAASSIDFVKVRVMPLDSASARSESPEPAPANQPDIDQFTQAEAPDLSIPPGLQPESALTRMIESDQAYAGVAVAVGINDFEALRDKLAASTGTDSLTALDRMIASLLGPQDFACRFSEDEYILLYPGESGTAAQRRLFTVSERLWDFQLRSLGNLSVMFSWGGLEVKNEPLAEAVTSARERMYQTRRSRTNTQIEMGLSRRRAVNA